MFSNREFSAIGTADLVLAMAAGDVRTPADVEASSSATINAVSENPPKKRWRHLLAVGRNGHVDRVGGAAADSDVHRNRTPQRYVRGDRDVI